MIASYGRPQKDTERSNQALPLGASDMRSAGLHSVLLGAHAHGQRQRQHILIIHQFPDTRYIYAVPTNKVI
jgi:hypothetical protein